MRTSTFRGRSGRSHSFQRGREWFTDKAVAATSGDAGMTTAEYAVGTVAACGFGGILYKLLTSSRVSGMLSDLLERALSVGF